MGLLNNWLYSVFRPFREMKSKWMGMKNIQDGLRADMKRAKGYAQQGKKAAGDAKKKAKDAKDKAGKAASQAKAAGAKAQGVWGQGQGQMQAYGGMAGGKAGGAPGVMGAPPPGGMPPPGAMPMAGAAAGGAMPGMAGPPGAPGAPGMAYGAAPPAGAYGAAAGGAYGAPRPGAYGAAPLPGAAPGPGVRTMAIMAGAGTATGYALAWVVPLKGPNRGQLYTLKPQSVIGKDPSCEVCFNDPFMSSRHATIRAQNGVYVLEDHSTNGTWVNDKQIKRHELVDNDFIKVGQTLMKFKAL